MKKKVLAAVLAVSTVVMAGCGSEVQNEAVNNEGGETVSAEASVEESAAEESAAEDSSSDAQATAEISDEAVPMAAALDPNTEYVFGTATLTYAEFYEGDVSSTDSYDVVSSATAKKYEIFPNMSTDFVDETTNADGYNILGVKNVNVAIPADQADAYAKINDSFVKADEEPSQYKIVTVEGDKAEYSATVLNVTDTVTDATAELLTGTNWGDYQLNVVENSTKYIRSSREDENLPIGTDIQGVIVETADGLKVGMEHLQSIWVMPYEISFNIEADNTHNQRVKFDNLSELSKLEEKEIVSVTFINQNDAYVYNFEPVYVKPVYRDIKVTGTIDDKEGTLTLSEVPEGLENPQIKAVYIVGKGHDSVKTDLCDAALEGETVEIDGAALTEAKSTQAEEGRYSIAISSDNYADIAVTVE